MEWLQSLDTAGFRFINQTLSNPVFDVLMPLLSKKVLLWPIVVVGTGFLVWKGAWRGRICLFMLALSVAMTDGVVCKNLKRAIARPRPYVEVTDANRLIGRGSRFASMPSSHSANWFAGTAVFFIYYRRSLWLFAPLAAAIAFSRVYNGVHYPGDVLTGAVLGAGSALAVMLFVQMLWQWFGKSLLPHLSAKLPSLLNPPERIPDEVATRPNKDESAARKGA